MKVQVRLQAFRCLLFDMSSLQESTWNKKKKSWYIDCHTGQEQNLKYTADNSDEEVIHICSYNVAESEGERPIVNKLVDIAFFLECKWWLLENKATFESEIIVFEYYSLETNFHRNLQTALYAPSGSRSIAEVTS
jgi:hypothetical protein